MRATGKCPSLRPCSLDDAPPNAFALCTFFGLAHALVALLCSRAPRKSPRLLTCSSFLNPQLHKSKFFHISCDFQCLALSKPMLNTRFSALLAQLLCTKASDLHARPTGLRRSFPWCFYAKFRMAAS